MEKSEKLKSCPFCGDNNAFLQDELDNLNTQWWEVICIRCSSRCGEKLSQEEAIELWNTRTPSLKPLDGIELWELINTNCNLRGITLSRGHISIIRDAILEKFGQPNVSLECIKQIVSIAVLECAHLGSCIYDKDFHEHWDFVNYVSPIVLNHINNNPHA